MSYKLHIEERSGYLYFRIDGENSRETIPQYMTEVMRESRERDCYCILIHECLSGPRLSPMDIFTIASEGSMDILGVFDAVAYVDEEMGEMLDFAETVAVNRGMPLAMFSSLAKAEDWILGQQSRPEEKSLFVSGNRD
jgi:hypothetical protein